MTSTIPSLETPPMCRRGCLALIIVDAYHLWCGFRRTDARARERASAKKSEWREKERERQRERERSRERYRRERESERARERRFSANTSRLKKGRYTFMQTQLRYITHRFADQLQDSTPVGVVFRVEFTILASAFTIAQNSPLR